MSIAARIQPIDEATRIEITYCDVTRFAIAKIQVRTGQHWADTGIGGCGNGRQDAVADLHARLSTLAHSAYQLFRHPEWVPA